MPNLRSIVLYLNEFYMANEIYPKVDSLDSDIKNVSNIVPNTVQKTQIIKALSNKNVNKVKKLSCDILFKMFYDNFKIISYSLSDADLMTAKIYSDHNFYYYLLQNYPELIPNVHNIHVNYEGYNAFKDFYSYFYSLYKNNKCAFYMTGSNLVLNDFSKKDIIIDALKQIETVENQKITPLLWKQKNRYHNSPNQSIRFDLDSQKYNTQLKFKNFQKINNVFINTNSGLRTERSGCFMIKIFQSVNRSNTDFYFNSFPNSDDMILDLKNGKKLRLASIYEMIDYFLENMQFKEYDKVDQSQMFKIKENYKNQKLKVPGIVRQFTDIDYIKTFEGIPWERYFMIEFFIKNNLINEEKLFTYLKPKNLEKYNLIKSKGLSNV